MTDLATHRIRALSAQVANLFGLYFPADRTADLERALGQAARHLGDSDAANLCNALLQDRLSAPQWHALTAHLTVGETYFWRDPGLFATLENTLLPELAQRAIGEARPLRLWSAACASGEEAYSLAIACLRALSEPARSRAAVWATDLNEAALARAEAAEYGPWSLRDAPDWLHHYVPQVDDRRFRVAPAVQRLVRFATLNLADPAAQPPALWVPFDLIVCRNVLMYLTPEHQRAAVAKLRSCLRDGGYLVTAPAEVNRGLFEHFEAEVVGGNTAFRRNDAGVRTTPGPELPTVAWHHLVATPVEHIGAELAQAILPAEPPPEPAAQDPAPAKPEPQALVDHARQLADAGRLPEAYAASLAAVACARSDPAAYLLCGLIAAELGRPGEAVTAVEKALFLDNDLLVAHLLLARLHGSLGHPRRSARHAAVAKQLLGARPRDQVTTDTAGLTSGRLLEAWTALGTS